MLPDELHRKSDSIHSDDTGTPVTSAQSSNLVSRRASRAMSINRLSKLIGRDSLTPAPTKEDFAMDAQAELFKQQQFSKFSDLMHRMDTWFSHHNRLVRVALAVIYRTRYWSASYIKMKYVMRNFHAPCNDFEMHVVCRVLDKLEIRRVSYKNFAKKDKHALLANGLGFKKLTPETLHCVPDLIKKRTELDLFPKENLFTHVMFIYGPFYDIIRHPGHFSEVVSLDTYVHSLKKLIEKRADLVTEVRIIYGLRFAEQTSSLPWEYTLATLGFKGGCEKFPTTLNLYYDIDAENRAFDCPLFLTSHYY